MGSLLLGWGIERERERGMGNFTCPWDWRVRLMPASFIESYEVGRLSGTALRGREGGQGSTASGPIYNDI